MNGENLQQMNSKIRGVNESMDEIMVVRTVLKKKWECCDEGYKIIV